MWHASAMMDPGWPATKDFLRCCAFEALEGMGDANLGQWEEWNGTFFHLRRRLTPEEQKPIGDAVDIRNTPEAERRRQTVIRFLPVHMRNLKE